MYKDFAFIHTDLDGIGATILFLMANANRTDDWGVSNVDNNEVDDVVMQKVEDGTIVPKETKVCFFDICASNPVLKKLKELDFDVQVIDHHRTNFFAELVYPNSIIVPEDEFGIMQSGTSLVYKWLMGGGYEAQLPAAFDLVSLGNFVDTVRSYDTYEWKSTNNLDAKYLQVLFQLLGFDRFLKKYYTFFMEDKDADSKPIISENDMEFVMCRIENEQKIIDEFTPDDVIDVQCGGRPGALALSTKGANISELGYQFLSKYPQYDFIASFTLARNGEFSFRAVKDDIDLGKDFAALLGGGGHPKAAGAGNQTELSDAMIRLLIDYLEKHIPNE